MLLNIKLFFSVLVLGLLLDYLWVGMVANKFYLAQYGDLARLKIDGTFNIITWAALIVYILISLGIVFFALPRVHVSDTLTVALA